MLKGTLKDELYHLENVSVKRGGAPVYNRIMNHQLMHKNKDVSTFVLTGGTNPVEINVVESRAVWHKRLGHPSSKVLNSILKGCNLVVNDNGKSNFCDYCQLEKSHNLLFPNSQIHAKEPFGIIYSDFWGPAPYCSNDGFRYYTLFLDDYNRYTWIYPLKQKSSAVEDFQHFVTYVKNQFNNTIKMFQSDNGGEHKKNTTLMSKSRDQLSVLLSLYPNSEW